jgi:hypothetical protein
VDGGRRVFRTHSSLLAGMRIYFSLLYDNLELSADSSSNHFLKMNLRDAAVCTYVAFDVEW